MQDLRSENYKTLSKEIKERTKTVTPYSLVGRLNVKM